MISTFPIFISRDFSVAIVVKISISIEIDVFALRIFTEVS